MPNAWEAAPLVESGSQPAWASAPMVDSKSSQTPEVDNNSKFDQGSLGSRAEDIASGANRFFTTILPGLPVDTVTNVVDLLKAGAGVGYHELTGKEIPQSLQLSDRQNIPLSSSNIQKNLEKYAPTVAENNYPANNDAAGRVLHNVGIGAGAAVTGSGGSLSQAATNAGLSIAPSIAQGVVAEKYPDSPLLQLAASMGAAGLQSGIRYGVPQLTKMALRGGEEGRLAAAKTIDTFEQTGNVPTVSQATGNRVYQGVENMLARVPGGSGRVIGKAEQISQNLSSKIDDMANNLSVKANPEQAGRTIYKGITGEHAKNPQESFIPKVRATQGALYEKLDQHIESSKEIPVSNTMSALRSMTSPIPGAPNLSKTSLMNNATLKAVDEAISADLGDVGGKFVADPRGTVSYRTVQPQSGDSVYSPSSVSGTVANPTKTGDAITSASKRYSLPGGPIGDGVNSFNPPKEILPYRAIKEMRTRIGEKISDVDLSPDVSKAQLRQLYGALSKDMEQAAKDAGPQAYAAFKRANGYTAAMHDRIDLLQSVIDKNGGPEKIYTAATSGTRDGATVLRTVMKSLPPDGKKMLSASILRRMGKATASQQNDVGDVFSTERFLTQWNTMSPEAKQAAFGGYSKEFTKDMDALAAVASNLRSGSKVFSNPSGTAQAVSQQTVAMTILGALATGHPEVAATAATGVGISNLAARALTSPRVVKWMVKTTQLPKSQLNAQIKLLALAGQRMKDQDAIDVANALQQRNQADN